MNALARPLAVLLAGAAAALAGGRPLAAEAYDLRVTVASETLQGKSLVLAKVATNLPDRSLLRGALLYKAEDGTRAELMSRREAVEGGKVDIPLDPHFGDELFPGEYQVIVTFDPESQYEAVRNAVAGKVRSPIERAGTLTVGGPGDLSAAVDRRRSEWARRFEEMAALGDNLGKAFHAQVAHADPEAWKTWLADWSARLDVIQRVEVSPIEVQVLRFPAPCQFVRDRLVHMLRNDVLPHCEAALRASPPDRAAVEMVDRWLDAYREKAKALPQKIRLARPTPDKVRGSVSHIEDLLRSFADWHEAWKAKAADHAASDWPSWRDPWRDQMGQIVLDLAKDAQEGLEEDFASLTRCVMALEEEGDRAFKAAGESAKVEPALTAARDALARLADKLAGKKNERR